jgi:hypothetical protein
MRQRPLRTREAPIAHWQVVADTALIAFQIAHVRPTLPASPVQPLVLTHTGPMRLSASGRQNTADLPLRPISGTQISARPLQRFVRPHLLNADAVSRARAKAS